MRQNTSLEDLSTRELQAYGALCLASFCAGSGIRHRSVDELLAHLVSLLSATSLPDWEGAGARLDFAGRGDPVPEDVARAVPTNLRADFHRMVDLVVEIGNRDMYGAPSEDPHRFALECTKILEERDHQVPDVSAVLVQVRPLGDQWGSPVSEAITRRVLEACGERPKT